MKSAKAQALLLLALAATLLLAAGCDTSFEAFADTERTYSVFGVLDANADTQYVRVEPLQDSTFAGSDGVDARVTSEHVETGETIVWERRTARPRGGDAVVYNFRAVGDFAPGATYRLRAERPRDGGASTAEVTLPPAFPAPQVLNPPDRRDGAASSEGPTLLRVRGVDRLDAVRADYDYLVCLPTPRGCDFRRRRSVDYHLADTTRRTEGVIEVAVSWRSDIPDLVNARLVELYSMTVTLAVASEDWPEYPEDNPPGDGPEGQPLPPPGIGTNVENGTGFVGGVFTRTVDISILRD